MIETIVAIIGFCLIMAYLSSIIDKDEHILLKLLFICVVMVSLVLLGKSSLDAQNVCRNVVANETVSGNVTSYEYTTFCFETTTSKTNFIFYNGILFIVGVFLAYVLFYFGYFVFRKIEKWVSRR